MRSFFEWFADERIPPSDPWLILGLGPTYSRARDLDLQPFRTLSLNYVVRERPVTVAHLIDYHVIDLCAGALERNAGVLVVPWVPHVRHVPGPRTLAGWVRVNPLLRRMADQGRLLWYNLGTAPWATRAGSPVIEARRFSAEAGLNLLARAGVRTVRSLGVDGGTGYSGRFEDLKARTRLATGWSSYDVQFPGIARTLRETGVDFAPLDLGPARIYVGGTEADALAARVLEHSLRARASLSVHVTPLHGAAAGGLPASLQRFRVPALEGRRGRALYLSPHLLAVGDVRRLWTLPFDGADVLCDAAGAGSGALPDCAVGLLDCERLRWDASSLVAPGGEVDEAARRALEATAVTRSPLDPARGGWRGRDLVGKGSLLHFAAPSTRPWVCRDHPLGRLWVRELLEAVDRNVVAEELVEDEVARGHVRPSLLHQLRERIEDGLLLPREAVRLDDGFRPPGGRPAPSRALLRPLLVAQAVLRRHLARLPGLARQARASFARS